MQSRVTHPILWIGLGIALVLPFVSFLRTVSKVWLKDAEFSYGALIPFMAAYILWSRRGKFQQKEKLGRWSGLTIALAGCILHVLGSLSGTLILSGLALAVTIMGATLYLRGAEWLRISAAPVGLLILMVPLPTYLVGQLSWYLQANASSMSAAILRFLGVAVYQDGNILTLSNFALEVEQACSGSRSLFALLALALMLGLSIERKWWIRVLLVLAAPLLAVSANIIRIVGTGLLAWRWGTLAANESLHAAWGVLVFAMVVMGLVGLERLSRWAANDCA
jgi:exosortase